MFYWEFQLTGVHFNVASSIYVVKIPNESKTKDIKLSKPLFDDENDFMTVFA